MSQTPPTPAALVAQTYGSREWCETFIASSLEPFEVVVPNDTPVKLAVEAGKDKDGAVVFRPYIRAAALLSRAKNTAHVNEGTTDAGGAKFRNAELVIAEWRLEQASLDAALGLTLPSAPNSGSRASVGSVAVKTYTDWS